jgi:hypothetical protein
MARSYHVGGDPGYTYQAAAPFPSRSTPGKHQIHVVLSLFSNQIVPVLIRASPEATPLSIIKSSKIDQVAPG